MGLFDFLTRNKSSESTTLATMSEPVESTKPSKNEEALTVSYVSGWPIDLIYGHLRKNYEGVGFDDAMINSDIAFMNRNLELIRDKFLVMFREVNLKYENLKQNFSTRLYNCNSAGLISTVAELEEKLRVINSHETELKQLENDFRNNQNEATIPMKSYECGFLRGMATVALGGNNIKQNEIH